MGNPERKRDDGAQQGSVFDGVQARTLDGRTETLSRFDGQVALVVNVASRCGFTPQYEALQQLQQRFGERDFTVLGFPCNQFGSQEPGDSAQIASFCSTRYGVTFPMFEKIDVNGPSAHPLYRRLKERAPGVLGSEAIKWNFTKFLVGLDGRVVARFAPTEKPESLAGRIEELLSLRG